MTCHRFGRQRPVAARVVQTSRRLGRQAALGESGDRSPLSKIRALEFVAVAECHTTTGAIDAPTDAAVLLVADVLEIKQEL